MKESDSVDILLSEKSKMTRRKKQIFPSEQKKQKKVDYLQTVTFLCREGGTLVYMNKGMMLPF